MAFNGLAFVTSGFILQNESSTKWAYIKKYNIIGRMYLFDFNKNKAEVEQLEVIGSNGGFDVSRFLPHGISGWQDAKTGKKTLFVVNHERLGVDCIEKFEFIPGKKQLKHVKRYRDDTMLLVNDVQVTGENSFYFTNFGTGPSQRMMMVQILGRTSWNTVVYFDGKTYRVVLDGMAMSNGLYMSNDGRQVYAVNSFPDNVVVDMKTGHLYVGSHPIQHILANHINDPEIKTPSQVLKLDVKDGYIIRTRELLYDDGHVLSGSSTAVIYNNKLLVGSIIDKLIICDVNVPI
ncbi:serum paraoxonase/arylesterase 2-like [Patella vulgata]|uniref:serum paraoxonase/arylesterase 2-like n=1 Tax=Patella vulgata TaxID=6465 RepID=UPI0024A8D72E|nr:serum paraoxonase/arylesterase 2-like [Patella vulgata]